VWAILVSQARPARPASPGVLAVFSAEHVIKAGFKSPRPILHFNERDGSVIKVPHRLALAHQRVRFVGEAVALVVGETEAAAQDAAERIVVDYRDLPIVIEAADALEAAAPLIHAGVPTISRSTTNTAVVHRSRNRVCVVVGIRKKPGKRPPRSVGRPEPAP
jgi:aerobic carbon-monoxide dehydrogenase large subunit